MSEEWWELQAESSLTLTFSRIQSTVCQLSPKALFKLLPPPTTFSTFFFLLTPASLSCFFFLFSASPASSSSSFMELLQLFFFFFFFFIFRVSSNSLVDSPSSDVELLLNKIKPSLQGSYSDNILLSSWNTSVPLCQWRGLKWVFSNGTPLLCTDLSSPHWTNLSLSKDPSLHLLSLQLPSANLSGSLPKELGELSALQSLYLNVNSLTGTIPFELGYTPSLSDLDLGNNQLTGALPPAIWNLCDRLVSLRLHANALSGSVPEPVLPNSTCSILQFLDLGVNQFSGSFPEFVTRFEALKELDLGNNLFSGSIPEGLSKLNLEKLNLSHNNFSGVLPVFSESKYGVEVFEGNNAALCGPPLGSCQSSSGLSPGAIAGIVIGLMTGAVVLASVLIGYVQGKKRKSRGEAEEEFEEGEDDENGSGGSGDGKLILFQGGEHLTLEDVLNATGQVMEKTSYGTVYKAKLADGGSIALRLLREGSCKDCNSCLPLIKQLGRVRHENLIPLRAFYQGKRGEKLLIYDYLPNRSLHDLLHGQSTFSQTLALLCNSFIFFSMCNVVFLEFIHACPFKVLNSCAIMPA